MDMNELLTQYQQKITEAGVSCEMKTFTASQAQVYADGENNDQPLVLVGSALAFTYNAAHQSATNHLLNTQVSVENIILAPENSLAQIFELLEKLNQAVFELNFVPEVNRATSRSFKLNPSELLERINVPITICNHSFDINTTQIFNLNKNQNNN